MPDRAVVEEALCHECGYKYLADQVRRYFVVRDGGDEYPDTPLCDGCADEYRHDDDVDSIEEEEPSPRAIVALSEDRQWLVVLEKESRWAPGDAILWSAYEWDGETCVYLFAGNVCPDTGQDANDVLAAWERQQG